jgi:hypothetical protein
VRPELKRALVMPITQLLDDSEFDRETKRVVSVAFEMAREALQLGDESNLAEKLLKESSSWQKAENSIPIFCVNRGGGISSALVDGTRRTLPAR